MDSKPRSGRKGTIGASAGASERPSRETVFDVLRNRRRQCLLRYLQRNDGDGPFELGELVDHVTAWETNATRAEITPAERKRVYNALRQTHLPKLEDSGMITYDLETNQIELAAAARDAQHYLAHAPGSDVPWHTYYLGLSALATVIVGAHWFEIAPLGGGSGGTIVGVVLAAFVGMALVHAVETWSGGRIGGRLEPTER